MRVFICYARDDGGEVAGRLYQQLRELGADPWLDIRSIPAGANWSRSIDAAITACDVFVVVLTAAAVESDDVEGEYLMALDEGKAVIPFVADNVALPRKLRGRQWVDARADENEAVARLAVDLGLIGPEPPRSIVADSEPPAGAIVSPAVDALRRLANSEVDAVVFAAADNTYVQFAMGSGGLAQYEAVSDTYHERPERLTETQKAMLQERGFEEVDNWRQWVEIGDEGSFERLARHALETLEEVYGVQETGVEIVFVGGDAE